MKLTDNTRTNLSIKYDGTTVTISDGTNTYAEVVSSRNLTLSSVMGMSVFDNLDGELNSFKVYENGALECELVGKDDEAIDTQENYEFTEIIGSGGSITYEDALYSPEDFPTQFLENPRSEMVISMKNRNPFNQFLAQNREY